MTPRHASELALQDVQMRMCGHASNRMGCQGGQRLEAFGAAALAVTDHESSTIPCADAPSHRPAPATVLIDARQGDCAHAPATPAGCPRSCCRPHTPTGSMRLHFRRATARCSRPPRRDASACGTWIAAGSCCAYRCQTWSASAWHSQWCGGGRLMQPVLVT